MPKILDLPLTHTDLGDVTLGAYLGTLLVTLWEKEEGFSGKRPFGNSGWKHDVYRGLVQAGFITGTIDEDGCLDMCDERAGDALILQAINSLFSLAPSGKKKR
jgi:hypothetical protein